ncbi:MAG: glycosyl hydrolase family 31 [Bacteroidetes bacterium HGW-Bacteroidetes-11]|jgi:alpha-glucosidase|nr:MAG: glycosyl hydrolase family 31 [Bacteroidetes bacterium HGW-Bacteroidetes-11]
MKTLYILFVCILFSGTLKSQNTTGTVPVFPGKCLSYQVKGVQVVFHCENEINVMLKLCSPGIIRFWYEQGEFSRHNESFAVVNEDIDNQLTWSVSEQESGYELYTSSLIIRIKKSPFQVRIYDKYQKLLLEDYGNIGFEKISDTITCSKLLREDENIYGLGEKSGRLNRRGSRFTMWNSDRPCYDINQDPLYKSIPFFMNSAGYGIFFDNTYRSTFDFGASANDRLTFSAPGGEMIYYFIYGPTMPQIIEKYMQLTGSPIMPPVWALGFSQCRGLLTNENLTREIAAGYRERQIPCDIIYQDIGWTNHLQDFNWRQGNYTNPVSMLSDLESNGFKVIVSQDPVISQSNKAQWKEADSLGYLVRDIRTGDAYDMPWPWGGNCGVVDFTNPEVAAWWGDYQQKAIKDGVKGFWTDMGEPAWSNIEDYDRLFMKHYLGMHNEIHNVYGHTWDKVVTEQFEKHNPGKRVFQMTRSAFAGMQRFTFGWSGDAGDGNDVTNGWNRLRYQIPLALSSGMCGIPFWSSDISGYCGDITDYDAMAELYVRWLQFGVFNPISRAHHEGNNAVEPWLFGVEAEKACKDAISTKYALLPYIYSHARQAYDNGLPLMRPLVMVYPDDKETHNLDNQFIFGSDLLVAPVVESDAHIARVYLPEGEWISFYDPFIRFQGNQWIEFPVTLQTIPVFVKAGAVIPMMPVMQYIFENPGAPVWYTIFPKANGKSTAMLYEDDGESNDYKKDIYSTTGVKCSFRNNDISILLKKKDFNGGFKSGKQNSGIRIYTQKVPENILIDGDKLKQIADSKLHEGWERGKNSPAWSYDKINKILWIRFPETKSNTEIIVKFSS